MRPAETEVEVDAASAEAAAAEAATAEAAAAEAAAAEAQALKLISMGFERTQVHEALRRSGGRLEAAVQMLLDAPDGQLPLDAPDGQVPPDAPDGQVPPEASGAALGAGAPSAPLCRWLWSSGSGADERWTPYSALESEEIERLFAAGIDRCFVAADRHIDFKTMRQVRNDAPSRYRAVRREANASSDGASAPVPVVKQPPAPPSSVPRVFAPPAAVPAVAAPPPPAVVRGASSAVSEEALEHLVAMGFSRGPGCVALKQTSNDVEAAINLLFDPTFQAQAAAAASVGSPAAPVSAAPAAPAASAVPVRPVGLARTNSTGVAYVPPALQRTPSAAAAAAATLAAAAAGGRFVFSPQPLGTHTYSPQLGNDSTPITTPRGAASMGAELGTRAELGTLRGGAQIDDSTPRGAERYAHVSPSSRAPPPAPPAPPKSVSKAFTKPYRPPGGDLD